ncbi:MliC family protein [Lacimicrobium alkaliphilum]|nr:MliC family protein [Lacimicrobium alkaliphilum]
MKNLIALARALFPGRLSVGLRGVVLTLFALLLSGCELISAMQVKDEKPVEFSRQQHYQCASGENIMISYSQAGDSAMLLYSGQTQVLPEVEADSGLRFQGGQWAWHIEGDKGELFYDRQSQPKERCTRIDDRKDNVSSLVSGNITLPASLPTIDRAVLDLRLYKYELYKADTRAEMVDWVQSPAFVHQQGSSTERPFQIGTHEPRDPKMGYYLTLYILEEGHRTHIGQCSHNENGLCKVLTQGQPGEVEATFRKLGL